jgi:acetyl-CoA acyltransferase
MTLGLRDHRKERLPMAIPTPDVVIVGTGMTAFGKHHDRSLRSLASEAVTEALADAGVTAADVGMVFFANATAGILHAQEMIRGQSSLRETGLLGVPIVNVENACASASTAFAMAVLAVRSGTVDVALAVGAEKLTHPDKIRSITAIGTAVDLEEDADARARLSRALLGWDPTGGERPDHAARTGSHFMDHYAERSMEYMARTGATVRDLAVVAAKNQSNGALNPKAQYRAKVTVEEVLASREVSPPLHLLMCSPISDGAAAVVVTSADYAGRLAVPAIGILAVALLSGRDHADGEDGAARRAAERAYRQAGIGPDDVDVVELHDAAAPGELFGYEDLGLCGPGEAPKLLGTGDTHLGGRVPVNTGGGLLARGHPIGATGCAQLVELADQLRGRAGDRQAGTPRIAVAHNVGGSLGLDEASAVVTVLSAPQRGVVFSAEQTTSGQALPV